MHAVLNTPVDRIRCSLVGEWRVPARVSSLSVLPSPLSGRVGVHITTFEACSSFTRVTACTVAHPPYVGFLARLRPRQLPGSGARKLPSSTNNLLGWVLPPLVICAVEAHPKSPFHDNKSHGKHVGGKLENPTSNGYQDAKFAGERLVGGGVLPSKTGAIDWLD